MDRTFYYRKLELMVTPEDLINSLMNPNYLEVIIELGLIYEV